MNTDSIISSQLVKNAVAVIEVGQKQFMEAVSIYKNHGKQFVDGSKAFYQDLWELHLESMSEVKKAMTGQKSKSKKPRSTKSKAKPKKDS